LLEFQAAYPEYRRWTRPALTIHVATILLSLTRSLWLAAVLVLGLHLIRRRSQWKWAVPLAPALIVLLSFSAVRHRIAETFQPDYYSNTERIEMWKVGWRMIRAHPLTGVGPGRIESLYAGFLLPGEPLPAYHGHLHNNALQLGAEFGVLVLGAALAFVVVLVRDLKGAGGRAADRDSAFLCLSALEGGTGFLVMGMLDYTYGHSLGLILLAFTVLSPLAGRSRGEIDVSTEEELCEACSPG
jgi:O-antigen ligase